VREVKRKVLGLALALLAAALVAPLGSVMATESIEIATVSQTEFITLTQEQVGKNVFIENTADGSFISGDFVGVNIVYREFSGAQHLGNVEKWGGPKQTVQNIFECSGTFMLDSVEYVGSFTFKMMGQVGAHVQWVVIDSDLTADGEPVRMHGGGTSTLQSVYNPDPNPGMPPVFIQNTFEGQIHFTPG